MSIHKVNLRPVRDVLGLTVMPNLLVETKGNYHSGEVLNANAVEALIKEWLSKYHELPDEDEDQENNTGTGPNTNGVQYVDLGLPSGTLWATMNIGAKSTEEVGDEFEWGGITPQDPDNIQYKYYDPDTGGAFKYNVEDLKTTLESEDDAAHVLMGGDWEIPTTAAVMELLTYCVGSNKELVIIQDDSGGMLFILKLVSTINNNEIIIPYYGKLSESEPSEPLA